MLCPDDLVMAERDIPAYCILKDLVHIDDRRAGGGVFYTRQEQPVISDDAEVTRHVPVDGGPVSGLGDEKRHFTARE